MLKLRGAPKFNQSEMFIIIDRQTGLQVGKPYKSKQRVRARRDKLDLIYGAYRYVVKET